MAPKEDPASRYVLRFDRGRFTLDERNTKKTRVLTASTEDARLTVAMRIAAFLVGLVFVAFGLGMIALVLFGIPTTRPLEWLGLVPLIAIALAVGVYGADLLGRGITGRRWADRYWRAAQRWLRTRFRPWHGVVLLLLFFGLPVLGELAQKGLVAFAIVMLPLAILAQVVCHEAGHLMAAGSVGYRPRELIAGPFVLHVDGSRPRFSLRRSWMALFGGLANYAPVRRTRGKDLWVVAAGPLANLLTAALALEVLGWPASEHGFADTFVRTFIWFGISMGLLNLVPLPRAAGGSALDGRELLDLLRGR